MEMNGEYQISANRQVVWEALNDPEVLKSCLPGCEKFERVSDTSFEAVITTKVGPIKTTFSSSIELSNIDPPNTYTITGEGNGGAAGYAKGSAKVSLTEDQNETILNYTVDANLKGKIGQMGSRVVNSVAKRMADEFFSKFAEIINARSDLSSTKVDNSEISKQNRNPRLLWYIGIPVGIALFIFGILVFWTD